MPFYSIDELRTLAAGRWTHILISAGIPPRVLDGRNHPCPKCGGRDRFAAFNDLQQRGAVHCRYCFTSGSPISPRDGVQTLRWWLGTSFAETVEYLADSLGYQATDAPASSVPRPLSQAPISYSTVSRPLEIDPKIVEAHTLFAREAYHRMDAPIRNRLAEHLQLASFSFISLRVGVTSDGNCSTWPMRDADEKIIGVRLASFPWSPSNGSKWSRRGSHSGLFVPREASADRSRLFVTEGASDTAAATSVGLFAIGRASCDSSTFYVNNFVRKHLPQRITIVADNDPPGRRGANRLGATLSSQLGNRNQIVDVICPPEPSMDLRGWISAGATASEIRQTHPIREHRQSVQQLFDFDSVPSGASTGK